MWVPEKENGFCQWSWNQPKVWKDFAIKMHTLNKGWRGTPNWSYVTHSDLSGCQNKIIMFYCAKWNYHILWYNILTMF